MPKPTNLPIKHCQQCKRQIPRPRAISKITWERKRFCSLLCKNQFLTKLKHDYIAECWNCNDLIIKEISGTIRYLRRKFCKPECFNSFVKKPGGRERIRQAKFKKPTNKYTLSQKIVMKYIQKYGDISDNEISPELKHTLNSLQKREIVIKLNQKWIFTEKGQLIKHGKIRKATPELFERIRNLPLRK